MVKIFEGLRVTPASTFKALTTEIRLLSGQVRQAVLPRNYFTS